MQKTPASYLTGSELTINFIKCYLENIWLKKFVEREILIRFEQKIEEIVARIAFIKLDLNLQHIVEKRLLQRQHQISKFGVA